jgi:hypothetical protein
MMAYSPCFSEELLATENIEMSPTYGISNDFFKYLKKTRVSIQFIS